MEAVALTFDDWPFTRQIGSALLAATYSTLKNTPNDQKAALPKFETSQIKLETRLSTFEEELFTFRPLLLKFENMVFKYEALLLECEDRVFKFKTALFAFENLLFKCRNSLITYADSLFTSERKGFKCGRQVFVCEKPCLKCAFLGFKQGYDGEPGVWRLTQLHFARLTETSFPTRCVRKKSLGKIISPLPGMRDETRCAFR